MDYYETGEISPPYYAPLPMYFCSVVFSHEFLSRRSALLSVPVSLPALVTEGRSASRLSVSDIQYYLGETYLLCSLGKRESEKKQRSKLTIRAAPRGVGQQSNVKVSCR